MTNFPAAAARRDESEFARAVRAGLQREGQKELPSRYFYDAIGSALFEAITLLPEYGLTRADSRILRRHASEIVELADRGKENPGRGTPHPLISICNQTTIRYRGTQSSLLSGDRNLWNLFTGKKRRGEALANESQGSCPIACFTLS